VGDAVQETVDAVQDSEPDRWLRFDGIDNVRDASGSAQSIIKYQLGMSLAFVYHVTPSLHLDIDYFRAQFAWSDVPGSGTVPAYAGGRQNMDFINTGVTMVW